MLPSGTLLGNYKIESTIAAGGMAVVYRARHVAFGEIYAVKVLLANLAMNPKVCARFMQEAQVQRQFQHENIVKVVDVVNQEGHVAIVMEYIEGPTLEGWMA